MNLLINITSSLSLGPDDYKQIIGDLRIIKYESDFDYSSPNDAAPNATCWAVCIVRYHPAFLRSTAVDPALVHLFYLVWLRTLVAVECALQLLKADKSAQTPGTLEFAERLDEYTLQKEASIELDARLKDARQQVIELLKWNATGNCKVTKTIQCCQAHQILNFIYRIRPVGEFMHSRDRAGRPSNERVCKRD